MELEAQDKNNLWKWREFFFEEGHAEDLFLLDLFIFLDEERKQYTVYPPDKDIFKVFELTKPSAVKVVILGQDPYHDEGQATGLAFSVRDGVKIPPSLRNIYKELELEGYSHPSNGDLTSWAGQGVFLLNSCLTVRAHEPNSHAGHGWERFTDDVIRFLDNDYKPKVFLLWGKYAQEKKEIIQNPNHLVLEAPHPSPFSANRGFFGCNHFRLANEFLRKHGEIEIVW